MFSLHLFLLNLVFELLWIHLNFLYFLLLGSLKLYLLFLFYQFVHPLIILDILLNLFNLFYFIFFCFDFDVLIILFSDTNLFLFRKVLLSCYLFWHFLVDLLLFNVVLFSPFFLFLLFILHHLLIYTLITTLFEWSKTLLIFL